MLIVGAKGFAKEVLEIVWENEQNSIVHFFDDITQDGSTYLFGQFPIVKTAAAAQEIFESNDARFTLGIGNPKLRYQLFQKFEALGGLFTSTISTSAVIGSFGVTIDNGCNILSGVRISNAVSIGKGTMVYYNSIITHDVVIGEFCEISPGATILGRAIIGDYVHIGAGAIIFPDVAVGNNAIVGAGAVVRQDVPENCTVVGIPAQIKKRNL